MAGCKCVKKGGSTYDPSAAGDLPSMDMSKVKDPLVKFEKDFPFYRLHIMKFLFKINGFGRDEIDFSQLKTTFDTPAFQGHFDEGSILHGLIASLPNCSETSVNVKSLSQLAILWCAGSFNDKCEVFFQQLNPPGQDQSSVSFNDKDWPEVFDQIAYLATFWT